MTDHPPITVTTQESGERIDALLPLYAPELSRSAAQRLIEAGLVTVNGAAVTKNYRAGVGDIVAYTLPEPEDAVPAAQDIALDIVYEDDDVIVVNKPKGMVVHPAPGHPDGTLVNALLAHCGGSLSGIGGVRRPGIVHRIDKDTSGLIAAAKNDLAHASLSAQLKAHTMSRVYEAIVVGTPKESSGVIDAPIGRHPTDRKRMCVTAKNSRPAVTRYEVLRELARSNGGSGAFTSDGLPTGVRVGKSIPLPCTCAYVRCELQTGRTHQIRVHMAYIGHPVLGDTVYGAKKPVPVLAGQCLHARELRFTHPRTCEDVTLCCPLPEYFKRILGV